MLYDKFKLLFYCFQDVLNMFEAKKYVPLIAQFVHRMVLYDFEMNRYQDLSTRENAKHIQLYVNVTILCW